MAVSGFGCDNVLLNSTEVIWPRLERGRTSLTCQSQWALTILAWQCPKCVGLVFVTSRSVSQISLLAASSRGK